jgi:hypothetical protein
MGLMSGDVEIMKDNKIESLDPNPNPNPNP